MSNGAKSPSDGGASTVAPSEAKGADNAGNTGNDEELTISNGAPAGTVNGTGPCKGTATGPNRRTGTDPGKPENNDQTSEERELERKRHEEEAKVRNYF